MNSRAVAGLATAALLGVAVLASAKPDNPEHGEKMGHHPGGPAPSGSGPMHGWEGRGGPGPHGFPAPSGSVPLMHGPGAQGDQGDLAEAFRHHRPKPEEAAAKMGELRASFAARREAHRERMRAEFGNGALNRPEMFAEFKKHARRMAFLNRAKFVATTELDEPKRTTTLTRIDKLVQKEQARHQSALAKLKAQAAPGPSGSAPAAAGSAAPAATGSAP